MGRDAVLLRIGVRQQQGHPRRPHELADRIEEHLERTRQIESGGECARELLEDPRERRALPGLVGAGRHARRFGREARAQGGDLAREAELVAHAPEHAVELALGERRRQREVDRLALLCSHADRDGEYRRRDRPHA